MLITGASNSDRQVAVVTPPQHPTLLYHNTRKDDGEVRASRSTAISLPYSDLVECMALRLKGKKEHTLGHPENPKEVMGSL